MHLLQGGGLEKNLDALQCIWMEKLRQLLMIPTSQGPYVYIAVALICRSIPFITSTLKYTKIIDVP